MHCLGKRGDDWLFSSSTGTPLDDRNLLRREVEPVCRKQRIARFGWHGLRHSFSTYGGNFGVAMPILQSFIGHTTPEMAMRYTHPLEATQREAFEQVAAKLWPAVTQLQPDTSRKEGLTN